jgi:hypothetical protein
VSPATPVGGVFAGGCIVLTQACIIIQISFCSSWRATRHPRAATTYSCCVAVFTRELELYQNSALAGILPAVAHISTNDDGAAATSWGYAFPPHIVVERGESLNEWCSRVQPNFATTLFVLMHVAKRLAQLHGAGLCHRDLKCDAVSPAR